MPTPALAIFTGKATPAILDIGGSQSWVLDRNKARSCKYAVLYFNDHAPWSTKGYTQHGSAFLVGRISDVAPSTDGATGRWVVVFDEYAEVEGIGTWGGWRNPVRYSTLEGLGIDETRLVFKPMPESRRGDTANQSSDPSHPPAALTIEAAKVGLAKTFGVKPDAIEIIIRG